MNINTMKKLCGNKCIAVNIAAVVVTAVVFIVIVVRIIIQGVTKKPLEI